jgi:hypothetical protein
MSNDEWRNWIKTSGYIGYVGCSFTWGQGLWNYDKNNKNTPTYDEYIFENIQPTEESDNVRKELRYPNLLSTHFGTDVISKMMNGGSDAQSYTILQDVLNSRSQNPEMSGKWPLEKMRLLIFQHSALVRNNHVFDYKGKKYRVNLKGGEHHVHIDDDNNERERGFGLFEIYPWQSIKINGDTKEQYEQCAQDEDAGKYVSNDIFFDWLVDSGITIEEFWLHHSRVWLRKIQDLLLEFDNLGIPIVCWHWEEELLGVIHEEEFDWIRSITAPIIVNNVEYPYYTKATEVHPNLFIDKDKEANNYPHDTDQHPSKYGHEIITSSIITNLQDRDITIYL